MGADTPGTEAYGSPTIVVVGFLFVIVVLAILSGLTGLLGLYFVRRAANERTRAVAEAAYEAAENKGQAPGMSESSGTGPVGAADASAAAEDDPVLLAVIAAAVHSVVGDRAHRIVSIRSGGPGWAQEGRRQIFSSHRLR